MPPSGSRGPRQRCGYPRARRLTGACLQSRRSARLTPVAEPAAKALREAADALDPDPGPAKGIDIDVMIAGRQAEVRALAVAHEWQANGSPTVPEDLRTDIQAVLGLRHNEQVVDGQIAPIPGTEDPNDRY